MFLFSFDLRNNFLALSILSCQRGSMSFQIHSYSLGFCKTKSEDWGMNRKNKSYDELCSGGKQWSQNITTKGFQSPREKGQKGRSYRLMGSWYPSVTAERLKEEGKRVRISGAMGVIWREMVETKLWVSMLTKWDIQMGAIRKWEGEMGGVNGNWHEPYSWLSFISSLNEWQTGFPSYKWHVAPGLNAWVHPMQKFHPQSQHPNEYTGNEILQKRLHSILGTSFPFLFMFDFLLLCWFVLVFFFLFS